MKNYSYFTPTPRTLEELKTMYRKLVFQHHPDKGGKLDDMQAVNNEYEKLNPIHKDVHHTKDGTNNTKKQTTTETPDHIKDLISELMKMDDIVIEVIGCFVWVTGNTKPYKEQLKALKFQWHSKKIAWYLKPEDYRRKNRMEYGLDEIREMYGTSGQINSTGTIKLDEVGA